MTDTQTLELFTGNLLKISEDADLSKTPSALEINRLRELDKENGGRSVRVYGSDEMINLRNTYTWTGDFPMCRRDGNKLLFYLVPASQNLVFQNLKEAYRQLTTGDRYYRPTEEGIQRIVDSAKSGEIFVCDMSDLKGLIENNDYYSYLLIDSAKTRAENELVQRVYSDSDRKELKGRGIRIYVSNPNTVLNILEGNNSAVSRVSCLNFWGNDYYFVADIWNVDKNKGRLVGCLK